MYASVTPDLREAAVDEHEQCRRARDRSCGDGQEGPGSGTDIRAGLTQLSDEQLDAVRQIMCSLLAGHFRDVVAYGAGWTGRQRQQPVNDSGPDGAASGRGDRSCSS